MILFITKIWDPVNGLVQSEMDGAHQNIADGIIDERRPKEEHFQLLDCGITFEILLLYSSHIKGGKRKSD